jgi:hypothetical protein
MTFPSWISPFVVWRLVCRLGVGAFVLPFFSVAVSSIFNLSMAWEASWLLMEGIQWL